MMSWMIANAPMLLSVFPFLVFVVILLWGDTSLFNASIITLALFVALAIFYWGILPAPFLISFGKGFFVALDIFIIILGAIFFLGLLEELGVIKNISYYLEHFSGDYRLQIILLAWLFEAFIEGTAGFGTPVAVVVPLLVGLGLSPIKALVVGLIGNSTAGVFGAAGTPIRVGFAGLNIAGVPLMSALINCVGLLIPVFILWVITRGRANHRKEFWSGLPFAIWAGIAFVVPSVFVVFWGQEFPSIIGSIIGIVLVYITTKLGLFVPKEIVSLRGRENLVKSMSALHAFLPYIILVLMLVVGKIFLGNAGLQFSLGFSHVFNLFNPGFAFILAGLVVMIIWRNAKRLLVKPLVSKSFWGAFSPFLVIISMSALVQIMIHSGQNTSGLPAAITLVAQVFETTLLPFFTPFIGAFGAFITGSVTVSNIMFGTFFNTAALSLEMNPMIILSLAVVGGALGNMIALSDMLAAQAVLGLKNQERHILRGVFVPCFLILIVIGFVGLALS